MNTGRVRLLHATCVADQGYFSTKKDFTKGISRPKTALAPLSVARRSGYSGTILFYPGKYSEERMVPKEGTFQFELSAGMQVIERLDMINRFLGSDVEPVVFTAALPKVSRYFDGAMSSGKFARLFVGEQPNDVK